MKEKGLDFVKENFDAMGWITLASLDGPVCVHLVREFYENIKIPPNEPHTIISNVKGKKLMVTLIY